MGLPTRLHGEQIAEFFGAVKGFCPWCSSMREWKVSKDDEGKFFKECKKCHRKKTIQEPELTQLVGDAKARIAQGKDKEGSKK
jgi:hypothetical protein